MISRDAQWIKPPWPQRDGSAAQATNRISAGGLTLHNPAFQATFSLVLCSLVRANNRLVTSGFTLLGAQSPRERLSAGLDA